MVFKQIFQIGVQEVVENYISSVKAYKLITFLTSAIIFSLIIVLWTSSDLFSAPPFRLLYVKSNGNLVIQSIQNEIQLDKVWTGNKSGDWLWNNLFFAISDDFLKITSIDTGAIVFSINLRAQLNNEEHPWRIGHGNKYRIFFCTYSYKHDVPLSKQEKLYNIYQVDINAKNMRKLPINDCSHEVFSVFNNKIYYTGSNGEIVQYDHEKGAIVQFT